MQSLGFVLNLLTLEILKGKKKAFKLFLNMINKGNHTLLASASPFSQALWSGAARVFCLGRPVRSGKAT